MMVGLMQQNALYVFTHDQFKLNEIKLHLKGTDFQLKVWETLLKIPQGLIGGHMWGPARKQAVLGWEAARNPVSG